MSFRTCVMLVRKSETMYVLTERNRPRLTMRDDDHKVKERNKQTAMQVYGNHNVWMIRSVVVLLGKGDGGETNQNTEDEDRRRTQSTRFTYGNEVCGDDFEDDEGTVGRNVEEEVCTQDEMIGNTRSQERECVHRCREMQCPVFRVVVLRVSAPFLFLSLSLPSPCMSLRWWRS